MLNVSIVIYRQTAEEIMKPVGILKKSSAVAEIFLIDNSPFMDFQLSKTAGVTYIFNNRNLGYGAAHNIAIRKTINQGVDYHLVINPDISFSPDILEKIESYMDANPDVGLLAPKILSPEGELQYQCKLLPSPADLIFRRFMPAQWSVKRKYRYEMQNTGYDHIMTVPYLQGSFMFLRTKALENVGLFDERFFMYPEDIDLSRRIYKKYRNVFYPDVQIIHHHQRASYKSLKMLFIHIWNMIKYFNKWGWLFDSERKRINKEVESIMN